ncbi:MAG: dienelactone hydrolase family protein [Gammaproteobacteria bacterium]
MKTETVSLQTEDGHSLDAYVVQPDGDPKGGIVVIQEIFGITGHIQHMTEQFAAAGYLAVAPAMYDRVEKNTVLTYNDFDAGRAMMAKLEREQCVLDMKAATEFASSAGKVGIVGFCWGGAMADLAACHDLVSAAVSYYGRMTVEWLDLHPTCPVLYHYGEIDELIPLQTIEQIQRKRTGHVRVWGGADHGFCCEDRPSFHKQAAKESMELTLSFFAENLK